MMDHNRLSPDHSYTSDMPSHVSNSGHLRGQSMSAKRAPASRHFQARGGNKLPSQKLGSGDIARQQAEVLQEEFGNLKSPAKELSRELGASERACRNWLAGINCMNLEDFFYACQKIPKLRAWGSYMMGLQQSGNPLLQAKLNELAMLVREHGDELFEAAE